jgi:CMP-N,N'-diacetyllegionaminic acid synthase
MKLVGDMRSIIGLIPARGGSKGIPRKNLKLIAGKPLIAWTIETALQSDNLSRVIVSTEDREIAQIAQSYGAEVPFMRPVELAQDESSSVSVAVHAIQWLQRNEGFDQEYLALLQPTSPLRKVSDIDDTIELAYDKSADAATTIVETHAHPYLVRRIAENGILEEFINCDISYPRRQSLPPAYFLNGAVYVNRCSSLLSGKTFYPKKIYGHIMPQERSMQVDSYFDLYLVDLILRNISNAKFE